MINRESQNTNLDYEMDQELVELEQEVMLMLDEYDVEFPSESEITMTINKMRPFVPEKEDKWQVFYEGIHSVLRNSLREIFYMSPLFWIANCLFLLIGVSAVFVAESDPYTTMLLLAPLPTITGLFEVFKSRNTGMAELEMSLKYSLQELILSKMVVVGGFNFLITLVLTASITFIYPTIWVWKLLLYWIAPFTMITAVTLAVVNRIRHIYALSIGLIIWIGVGAMVMQIEFFEKVDHIPTSFYIAISIISAIISIIKLVQIYKRGITYEFNY
ncbi:hypothetical protein [Fredinandcohnia quinoae]|uniref:Uncharacterized protein n=1 Tax=Fredinandcohnia quinoae TaxID=2918902 RepID=A0AAW5E2B4_9BACI|nr:hypothetical protein [Fredinandcohnia sp. SECRCQ15]MCH1627045.1 hypothetical protein [Fredinandcohnia sp. SECRCQ15]